MADVGLNLKMTETVSSIAPKASQALKTISQQGEQLKDSLNLKDIEPQWKAFIEKVEKLHTLQEANKTTQAAESAQVAETTRTPVTRTPETILSRTGNIATQLGRTGDVTEAGAGLTGMIGGMIKDLGPMGSILAGISVTALALNALSKQYEQLIPSIMGTTAALGELKGSSKETGKSFDETRTKVGKVADEYGYSLQTGLATTKQMAEISGVGRGRALGALGNVETYARGFGVRPEELATYRATAMRYEGPQGWGNVLGIAAGGLQQSGMGPGQYKEFLNATLEIFKEGLSKGIVQGFNDINVAQVWISQLGKAFQGQNGIALYNKMQGATEGGTRLSTESDVIMYRAAKRAMEEMPEIPKAFLGVGNPSNPIDVFKFLEKGAATTPLVFEQVRKMVEQITNGNIDAETRMLHNIYPVNWTTAEKLLNMKPETAIKEIEAQKAESPEMNLLSTQQRIKNEIIGVGKDVSVVKGASNESALRLLGIFKHLTGVGTEEAGTIKGAVKKVSTTVENSEVIKKLDNQIMAMEKLF